MIKKLINYIVDVYIKRNKISIHAKNKYGSCGDKVYIQKPYLIHDYKNIFLENGVTILKNSRIQAYSNKQNHFPKIIIGENCYIGFNNSFLAGDDIIIGKNVLFASNILVTSENHGMNPLLNESYIHQPLVVSKVIIEDGVWIGEKVIILPGVKIGKKSIIGAGSIVTNSVPSYSLVVGNPGRVIKKYNIEKECWEKFE